MSCLLVNLDTDECQKVYYRFAKEDIPLSDMENVLPVFRFHINNMH